MLDVLLAVVLLCVGAAGGWAAHKFYARMTEPPKAEPAPLPQTELDRLRAEQEAFDKLMGYNIDTAYGLEEAVTDGKQ
ncbi:MAG: hypothetical protein II008_03860 [Oscillospiraceae bacterium]|nr:hypothetical protein [Oscillospiraceae bacterium]